MIVRLMGEGQYELDKNHSDEMNRIDNNIVKFVTKGDERTFRSEFKKLTDYVHRHGKKILSLDSQKVYIVIIPN
jgi:hypothetical protein